MSNSVTIIAEAGVNHNGDMGNAIELIDVAADAGADFVKFQSFVAESNISREAPKAEYQIANCGIGESQLEMVKRYELSRNDHLLLIDHCKKRGIRFLSTAFDFESIELLKDLQVPFWKIPSGELDNVLYLRRIAGYKEPVVLSTGMATLEEIGFSLNVLTSSGVEIENITILHCNTEYPTPMSDVNLTAMATIASTFGTKVGYSDHTLGIEVPIAAVAMGAVLIEKHFTLDRRMEGPDHAASLEPNELAAMVCAIRNIEKALGDGIKKPSSSEKKNIEIARKSFYTAKNLHAGHIIDASDLQTKRPGNGISVRRADELIGRRIRSDLPKDYKLSISDFD